MKKLLLPLLFISGAGLFAQPTITQAEFPLNVGDIRASYPGTFAVPSTGASQTWNYTTWSNTGGATVNWVAPATSGITGLPSSTACLSAAGTFDCYLIDASGMLRTGIAGSGVTMAYNNNERILSFPITFGQLTVDAFRVNDFTAPPTYPSHRSGIDSTEVTGYGTLQLPGSVTFNNAMQVKTSQHYKDSVDYGGFWVVMDSYYVSYNYYVANEHGSVATITYGTNTLSGATQAASWSEVGVPGGIQSFDISGNLDLFPNPAQDYFAINNKGNIDINGYDYSIVNMNGQTVRTGIVNGDNLNFDVSDLPAGLYLMNINSNDFNASKRFIKN